MPKTTPSPLDSAGSPSPEVVSAVLAALQAELAEERAARRATEAALCEAEAARQTAEARAARLEAENAYSAEQISRLEHLNKELRKALFGPRSEKLNEDERQLSFEEFWAAIAEAGGRPEADDQEQDEEADGKRRRRSSRGSRSGVRFGPQVDRREEVIEPDTIMCPCGCGEMTKIGEDRSERLDYEPAKFTVVETVRPRYACNKCKGGGVVQSPAPAALVEGGSSHRGSPGAGADREVRRPPSAVPSIADLRALRRRGSPRDAGDVGGAGVVSPAPRGRLPEGRAEEV